mmetsp:Transcript_9835/g.24527  ORF Transcript_9835/g.24527 Transcript_9835/m.24527 type:complete len:224 (+) Transcript_9835:531-1202(+)
MSTGTQLSCAHTSRSSAASSAVRWSAERSGAPSLYTPPSQLARSVYSSLQEKGVVSTSTPPGARASRACCSTRCGSGTRSSRLAHSTASYAPAMDAGSAQASPCTKLTRAVSTPSSSTADTRSVTSPSTLSSYSTRRLSLSLPATSITRVDRSTPVTAEKPARASSNVPRPTEQPRSSAREHVRPERSHHAAASSAHRRWNCSDDCSTPPSPASGANTRSTSP